MEQPTDRDPEERHYVRTLFYVRRFCSFMLQRIVSFYVSAPGISTHTHSLTHRQTTDGRNAVPLARPLVQSAKNYHSNKRPVSSASQR